MTGAVRSARAGRLGPVFALGLAVAAGGAMAQTQRPATGTAPLPPAIATYRPDSAFARGAALYASELVQAGAHFRAAEWSLALAGAAGAA
ncbi:MAG TPA: hypothetical protein VNM87_11935, partial [Candidatus Udaeobacter sp.]|nr:hypothetical protein [Candidatus Udaeobacter sp.]